MRRLLVVLLLIALLPLRAWAGDAMAVEMALMAQAVQATPTAAHGDCHEHSAAAQPSQSTPAMDNCNHCAACQACFSVALEPVLAQGLLLAGAAGVPVLTLHPYASADLALGQKPPIS